MRWAVVVFVLAASYSAADPDVADLARRLDDDDPRVRAAAREEALDLPESCVAEVRRQSGLAKSPEGKQALLEIARSISCRRARAAAKALLERPSYWESEASRLESLGPDAVDACLYLERNAEEFADIEASVAALRIRALQDVSAWTLTAAKDVTDAGWEVIAARVRNGELEQVRLDGLERAGYAVRAADPNASAKAWSDAAVAWSAGDSKTGMSALESLLRRRFPPDIFSGTDFELVVHRLKLWVAVSRDSITVEGGVFAAVLSDEAVTARAKDPDSARSRGAFREIARRGLPMPSGGWQLLSEDEEPAVRFLAQYCGRPAFVDLSVVLKDVGADWDNPVFASFWDPKSLADFAGQSHNTDLQVRALRILARFGDASAAAAVLPLLDPATPGSVRGAAAGVVARFGKDEDLPRAAQTLDPGSGSCDRQATAAALARRGVREGLLTVLSRLGAEGISLEEWNACLGFIESAPARDEPRSDWARRVAPLLKWDAAAGKWRTP